MTQSNSNVPCTSDSPRETLFRCSNLDRYFESVSIGISSVSNGLQKQRIATPNIIVKKPTMLKCILENQIASINLFHERKCSLDSDQAVRNVLKAMKNHPYAPRKNRNQCSTIRDAIWCIDIPTIYSKNLSTSYDLQTLLPNIVTRQETRLKMYEYERYSPTFLHSRTCLSVFPLNTLEEIQVCTSCLFSEKNINVKQENDVKRRSSLLMHLSVTKCKATYDVSAAFTRYVPLLYARKDLNTERHPLRKIWLPFPNQEHTHSYMMHLDCDGQQSRLQKFYDSCIRASLVDSTNALPLSPTWKKLENRKSFIITSLSKSQMNLKTWKRVRYVKRLACCKGLEGIGHYNTMMAKPCDRAAQKAKLDAKMHINQLLPRVCRGQGKRTKRVYDQEKQCGKLYDLLGIQMNLKHSKSDTFETEFRRLLRLYDPAANTTMGGKRKLLSGVDKEQKDSVGIPGKATKMLEVRVKRKTGRKIPKLDTASIEAFVRGSLHTFNVAYKRTKTVEDEATKQKRVIFINPDYFKRWGVQVMRYLEKELNCVVLERTPCTMRYSEAIVVSPDYAIIVLHLIQTTAKLILQDIIYLLCQYRRVDIYINASNFTEPYHDAQYRSTLELQRMIFSLGSVCKVRLLYYDSVDMLCTSISRYSNIQHTYSAYVNATDDDISDANEATGTEYFLCQFPCFNVYSAFHIMSKYEGIRTFMSACMNEMLVEQRSLSTTTKVRRPNRTDALNIPDSREKKILWRHILSMQYP